MSKESTRYINQDVCLWEWKPTWKDWLLGNSGWYIYHYLIHLRAYEYYSSVSGGGGGYETNKSTLAQVSLYAIG